MTTIYYMSGSKRSGQRMKSGIPSKDILIACLNGCSRTLCPFKPVAPIPRNQRHHLLHLHYSGFSRNHILLTSQSAYS